MFKSILRLIELQGLQASGKTTLAKRWQKEFPNVVRVNRDELRSMLRGAGYNLSQEPMVIACERAVTAAAIKEGYNVVIDDVNLFGNSMWKEMAEELGVEHVAQRLDVSVEEAIKRDSQRENPVGPMVIRATAKRSK